MFKIHETYINIGKMEELSSEVDYIVVAEQKKKKTNNLIIFMTLNRLRTEPR